jgi:hypothetical protein
MSKRHVPFITGAVCLAIAAFLLFRVHSKWTYFVGPLLILYGIGSLRTAVSATDEEIRQLTTSEPMSDQTERKLRDRL